MLLPIVLREYGTAAHRKLHELGVAAGVAAAQDSDCDGAEKFIAAIEAMNAALHIPTHLAGIRRADIPRMARHADREANPLYPVPKLMDAQELQRFYERVAEQAEA